jgi:predicted nucleic acid-binding protein
MAAPKIKIVLDADVIIHFTKGGKLDMLPQILPGYKFVVLDVVKREIPSLLLPKLLHLIEREKTITEEAFGKTSQEIKEYARLISSTGPALGRGESACMVYCRYHHNVVGSSNTKDITDYCNEYGITFLTTNDFLYYAIRRGLITVDEAHAFIKDVINKGSNPPIVDFNKYVCSKLL